MGAFRIFSRLADLLDVKTSRASTVLPFLKPDGSVEQRQAATSDVSGLDAALAGKAAASHTHSTAQVTGLDAALAGKAASSHTHATSEVTGLDAALAGKALSSHTHAWQDVSKVGAIPADVGSGTIATSNYTFADTPPASPAEKDIWVNTATMQKFVRYGNAWVETSGAAVTPESVGAALASVTEIDGSKDFSGQIELTGQAVQGNYSALNYGLLKRFGWHHDCRQLTSVTGWTSSNTGTGTSSAGAFLEAGSGTTQDSYGVIRASGYSPLTFSHIGTSKAPPSLTCGVDYESPWILCFRLWGSYGNNESQWTGTKGFVLFGRLRSLTTFELATKGVGLSLVDGAVFGIVHNGTTLITTASPLWSWAGSWPYPMRKVMIHNDGAGNVGFYVDGLLAESLAAGITGQSGPEGSGFSLHANNYGVAKNVQLQIPLPITFSYLED